MQGKLVHFVIHVIHNSRTFMFINKQSIRLLELIGFQLETRVIKELGNVFLYFHHSTVHIMLLSAPCILAISQVTKFADSGTDF